MIKHVYLTRKNQAITWPNHNMYQVCHVHLLTGLVQVYHYISGTWQYVSYYIDDTQGNNN